MSFRCAMTWWHVVEKALLSVNVEQLSSTRFVTFLPLTRQCMRKEKIWSCLQAIST